MNKIKIMQFMTTGIIFDRLYKKNLVESSKYCRGVVLDAGCGTKPYKSIFPHDEYIGLDTNNKDADKIGDITDIPFKDNTFDTVLCFEVIEHLEEPQKAFQEMKRVLKTNGHIILTTPQSIFLHGEPYDYFRFTEHGLKSMADTANLKIVKCLKTTGSFGTIGFLLVNAIFNITGQQKTPFNYIAKSILLMVCIAVQIEFALLDALCRYKGSTVDNLIILKKKGN